MEDGTSIDVYTLTNSNRVRARIMTLGATLMTVETPDRNGTVDDITMHRDSLEGYLQGHPLLGSVVGRYANRIGGAKFTIDGVEYPLVKNHGEHHIHGGGKDAAFHWKVWDAEPPFDATKASEPFLTKGVIKAIQGDDFAGVALTLISPDGEGGFPGELHARVVYELNNENELTIRYSATTTKPTHVNLTNHAYWNLDGIELIDADAALDGHAVLNDRSTRHGDVGIKIDASGHSIWIDADHYLDVDEKLIPSGRLIEVEGTPFDFRRPHTIGERVEQLDPPKYDHCYVLDGDEGVEPRLVASAVGPNSGRTLQVYTTEPGVQFYTGNPNGFCFETQHYPNAPNISSFPSTLLRPGETFESTTIFKFGVD
jgi:aldose 1-epimerase